MSRKPNIILILADDMGFSDIGCFGSEIATPNLDRMAQDGVRFTQMYNCARCCPTRASMLTGLYPHQAGVGHMVNDAGTPAYQGYLREDTATIAEALRAGGYRTLMSGKWHVGGEYNPGDPATWRRAGDARHPTPRSRGFDRFYGSLTGAGSYFTPPVMFDDDEPIRPGFAEEYYLTDAISDRATQMIAECPNEQPFFLYLAYTAPHWPLHAKPEDIAKYTGTYRSGWDTLRTNRHETLRDAGVVDRRWPISPRDPDSHPFGDERNRDWEAQRMAVYAAQVDTMDQGIGRVLQAVEARGQIDDTLVVFLSDNGGCAEFLREDGTPGSWPEFYGGETYNGGRVHVGNTPSRDPGGPETFMSYDLPWANASNTPFRLFKHWVHEGGISTPCVVSYPRRHERHALRHTPLHVVDLLPTFLEAAGIEPPTEIERGDRRFAVRRPEGESFLSALGNDRYHRDRLIFWEHEGNRAVRDGDWKLVRRYPGRWEVYHIGDDRTELNDLSIREGHRLREMASAYDVWAQRCEVREWPL